jgi:hypothetical protein
MRVAADVSAEPVSTITVRRLHAVGEHEIRGLADVLVDCVDGGASISFLRPLAREKALAFWRGVADAVAASVRCWSPRTSPASSGRCNSSSIFPRTSRIEPTCRR